MDSLNSTSAEINNISGNNLAVNSNFRINQRGLSEYVADGSSPVKYTVDRWCIVNNKQCAGDSLKINTTGTVTYTTSNKGAAFIQYSEYNKELIGLPLTISCKVKTLIGNFDLVLNTRNSSVVRIPIKEPGIYTGSTNTTSETIDFFEYYFTNINPNGVTSLIEVEWVKVETGVVSTSYSPADPAIELEKCKRYFQISRDVWACNMMTSNNIFFPLFLNEMRVAPYIYWYDTVPTTETNGVIRQYGNSVNLAGFIFTFETYSPQYFQLCATKNEHGLQCPVSLYSLYFPIALDAEIYP